MLRFELVTDVRAGAETCFDLSRDVDLHLRSMAATGERAIRGRTSGLLGLGEEVTWRGRHFGVVHEHASRITAYDRPRHFRDEMIAGRFRRFAHDHYFEPAPSGTRMRDVLEIELPCGLLGRLLAPAVGRYLERLLRRRNGVIAREAEALQLRRVPEAPGSAGGTAP